MTPELFRKLAALGLSHDQMAGVLEIIESDAEVRKAKARARVQKWRSKNKPETLRNVTEHTGNATSGLTREGARVEDITSNLEISGNKEDRKTSSSKPIDDQFEAFWAIYPRKVAKADARKLFPQSVKLAGFEPLIAGVRRFAAERAGEEPQYTMHPDKWLRGQHWNDEPAPPREMQPRAGPAPPRVVHGVTAALGRRYERQEQWDEQRKIGRSDADAQRIPADERQLRLVAGYIRSAARGAFD